jgi:plastocyanin
MRVRPVSVVMLLLFAAPLFAKDVYLSIGGSVGNFRTDARIFNPSFDKDITITARYLPAGNADNSGVGTKSITVPKRSMAIYDDVVQSLFGGGPPLGAVRLTSDDDFVAMQRIYADLRTAAQAGTLGQFVPGLEPSAAIRKGVLIGLKSGTGTLGAFRTNWGGVNPSGGLANVTLKLYDKTNALVDTKTIAFQPFGVQGPTNITAYFNTGTKDITDCWMTFDSDQPVFLYGSVVDFGSTDPTFITASADTGVAPVEPQAKTVRITARNWAFEVTQSDTIRAGDKVKITISKTEGTHGIVLLTPNGGVLLQAGSISLSPTEFQVTFPTAGTYEYACTNSGCGIGHTDMIGSLVVQ